MEVEKSGMNAELEKVEKKEIELERSGMNAELEEKRKLEETEKKRAERQRYLTSAREAKSFLTNRGCFGSYDLHFSHEHQARAFAMVAKAEGLDVGIFPKPGVWLVKTLLWVGPR